MRQTNQGFAPFVIYGLHDGDLIRRCLKTSRLSFAVKSLRFAHGCGVAPKPRDGYPPSVGKITCRVLRPLRMSSVGIRIPPQRADSPVAVFRLKSNAGRGFDDVGQFRINIYRGIAPNRPSYFCKIIVRYRHGLPPIQYKDRSPSGPLDQTFFERLVSCPVAEPL